MLVLLAIFASAAAGSVASPMNPACAAAAPLVAAAAQDEEAVRFSHEPPPPYSLKENGPVAAGWVGQAPTMDLATRMEGASRTASSRSALDCANVVAAVDAHAARSQGPATTIRLGLPVLSPDGAEAVAVISKAAPIGGERLLIYLRRDSAGEWRILGHRLLALS